MNVYVFLVIGASPRPELGGNFYTFYTPTLLAFLLWHCSWTMFMSRGLPRRTPCRRERAPSFGRCVVLWIEGPASPQAARENTEKTPSFKARRLDSKKNAFSAKKGAAGKEPVESPSLDVWRPSPSFRSSRALNAVGGVILRRSRCPLPSPSRSFPTLRGSRLLLVRAFLREQLSPPPRCCHVTPVPHPQPYDRETRSTSGGTAKTWWGW